MTKVAALLMSIVLFLGGGAGLTAYAAQDALPGDALYGIKCGLEQTQLALSSTAAGDFELHLRFATERLDEITALLAQGRYEDAEAAVDALECHLEEAAGALQVVAQEDPILASELASRYGNFMTESRQAIAALVLSAPQGAQGVLGDALSVVEGGSGEQLDGDDIDQPDEGQADEPAAGNTDQPDEGQADEPADGNVDHRPDGGQADEPDAGNIDQPDEGQADEPADGNVDHQPDQGQADEPADGNVDHQPDQGQADEPDGGNVDQPDDGQVDGPDAGNIDQADNVEPNEIDQPDVNFE